MKIYELLSTPDKWTRGTAARREDGTGLFDPLDPDACCWCLAGAVIYCYPHEEDHCRVSDMIYGKIRGSIVRFNDSATYEDVISLVKELDV